MNEQDNIILLRTVVRRVLVAQAGYALTEGLIVERCEQHFPGQRLDISDVREAVEWNTSKGFLTSRINPDLEEREWLATKAGVAKENIK